MTKANWLIYGANGYTGRLIAQEAARRGLKPVLAGRNPGEVQRLGNILSMPTRVFGCDRAEAILDHMEGISLVLHCAGPFSATSKPMLDACVKAGAHYLDITGEIPVFERVFRDPARFKAAGIVVMPGVGFDVVPSDCLAAMLKRELPDALKLELAFRISATASPGTSKTLIEGLYAGTLARRGGKLKRFPAGSLKREVRFWGQEQRQSAMGIPWGDVSTAFYSTAIPEITTYLGTRAWKIEVMRASRVLSPLLGVAKVQSLLKSIVDKQIKGPDASLRAVSPYYLWGRVENAEGKSCEIRIKTPNGYSFTVDSALEVARRVLTGELKPGAYTPSLAFGPDFIKTLPGIEIQSD